MIVTTKKSPEDLMMTLNQSCSRVMLAMITVLTVSGCLPAKSISISQKNGGSSGLSSVDLKLPSAESFKPSSGSAVVNAYALSIQPQSDQCLTGTKISETKGYQEASLAVKLAKGCDYNLTLALGEKDNSGRFTAYYETPANYSISKSQLESTSLLKATPNLLVTVAGKSKGMPESIENKNIPKNSDDSNSKPPQPDNNQESGDKNNNLASKIDVNITKPDNSTLKLSEFFTTEYMAITFSSLGCMPCRSHASEINADSQFKKMMDGSGKCKMLMMLENTGQLSGWNRVVGSNSFTAKNSYSYEQGSQSFIKVFGISQVQYTPRTIVVNRKGEVLADGQGAYAKLESLCR